MEKSDWRSKEVVSISEAAKILGVSRGAGYKWAAEGRLPAFKLGSSVRVRTRDLSEIIDGQRRLAA